MGPLTPRQRHNGLLSPPVKGQSWHLLFLIITQTRLKLQCGLRVLLDMLVEAFLGAVGQLEGELHRGDPGDVEEAGDTETGDEVKRGQHDENT